MEPSWNEVAQTLGDRTGELLRAMADFAPRARERATAVAIPTSWFRWLDLTDFPAFDLHAAPVLLHGPIVDVTSRTGRGSTRPLDPPRDHIPIERSYGERLAALDQVRAHGQLRLGWLFVAGTQPDEDGRRRDVLVPLYTVPIRVKRSPLGKAKLLPTGDVELTTLIEDDELRGTFERPPFPLGRYEEVFQGVALPAAELTADRTFPGEVLRVASAAGFDARAVIPAGDSPSALKRRDALVVAAGLAIYATTERTPIGRASSLRAWADSSVDRWTAFHSLYLGSRPSSGTAPAEHEVVSPFVLTPRQRRAVMESRTAPVTVVSGAPGTGKSHTITAIAYEAIARGESVLVAAKSDATVDALIDLFERGPGPDPLVFGSNERRDALATKLAAGQLKPEAATGIEVAGTQLREALTQRESLRRLIEERLDAEATSERTDAAAVVARTTAPGFFQPSADLDHLGALLQAASAPGDGFWSRRKQRKADDTLRAAADTPFEPSYAELGSALDMARRTRTRERLIEAGGLDLTDVWPQLDHVDTEVRRLCAHWVDRLTRSPDRLTHATLAAVSALATALRSGRAARRAMLTRLDDDRLTTALPLWVGSLPDIDELLPSVPALFDLVVLDEASSIDQPLAVPALLRAERAVVVGDPRQLRHVSFISDERIREALERNGIDTTSPLAATLDVRRNSMFDVAAGAAPVLVLDEQFRSAPHLIDFVASRLYDGEVNVATRSPETDSIDCIDVRRVNGERDDDGVVAAEVEAVIDLVRRAHEGGERSVGVVTPFRAQADALEQAALAAFDADQLEALDLRVGTVHAFQGNERDLVIASLGIGPTAAPTSWRFIDDSHLFTVFVTRARRQLIVVRSADPPAGGLVAEFLSRVDAPPGPPRPAHELTEWPASVADDLEASGLPVTRAYPCGRHVVDVCVGDHTGFYGITCQVHPDGPHAHIERELELRRAGWTMREAFRSRWEERPGELIVELTQARP